MALLDFCIDGIIYSLISHALSDLVRLVVPGLHSSVRL